MIKKQIDAWKRIPKLFRVITYVFLFLSLCIHIPFLEKNVIIAWLHLIVGGVFLIGFFILIFEPSEEIVEESAEETEKTDIPVESK